MPDPPPKQRKGFAVMDRARVRGIAAFGGASVPADKQSFTKDRTLAAEAGRKGGQASRGGGRQKTKD
jgi:general stress protein YciG